MRQASSAAPQTYLEECRALYLWDEAVKKTFRKNREIKCVVLFDETFFSADGGSLGCKSRVLRTIGSTDEGRKRKAARTATQPRGGHSCITILRSDGEIVFCVIDRAG